MGKTVKKKGQPKDKYGKVCINYKVLLGEKNGLKSQANKYAGGNVTKLIRLLARGYFKPIEIKKAA